MRRRVIVLVAAFAITFVTAVISNTALAQVPRRINYQARLVDVATGEPLAGGHDIVFSIYTAEDGGDLIWSETRTLSADSSGVVSVVLGQVSSIDIAFDGPTWLEVEVDDQVLHPRRELVSVPYALHSVDSDSLGGHDAAEYLHVDDVGLITGDMIGDGEIANDDIAGDAAIDPAKIDGTAWTSENDGSTSGLDADMVDGLHADAFSDTGHTHDARYRTQEELGSPGSLNDGNNPVDWTKLKNVPDGFADGTDDTGTAVGDGHSLDASDGSPTDVVYADAQGRVGIGTTTPGEQLDVAGSLNLLGRIKVAGDTVFTVDGEHNVLIGRGAGRYTTGDLNTFVGLKSGRSNTDGHSNTFVGTLSGASNGSGTLNTFIGVKAGMYNSGGGNTFLGYVAGMQNTEANFNTFVGYYAGMSNTTATGNTFVGASAGSKSIGESNTFIGTGAGIDHTSGDYNTFLGNTSGHASTTASSNTLLGAFSGYNLASGGSNTFVGMNTGRNNLAGSGNVFIGHEAGYNVTGSDKLCIANGRDTSDVLIYGDFSSGKVGIGVDNPTATLTINENISGVMPGTPGILIGNPEGNSAIRIGSDAQNYGGLEWIHPGQLRLKSSGEIYFLLDNSYWYNVVFSEDGDVGIGTDTPERKLHIKGANPRILIEATSSNAEVNFKNESDPPGTVWSIYKESLTNDLRFYQNGDRLTIESSTGNVAIGTDDPAGYKLKVNGTACGTSSWATCSDLRFKQDIEGIGDAIAKVMSLRGVSFRWKDDDDKNFDSGTHYGMIAQEVEQVLPDVVTESPDGEKAVLYTELIPVLLESIKAQQHQIAALQARVEELESSVDRLE